MQTSFPELIKTGFYKANDYCSPILVCTFFLSDARLNSEVKLNRFEEAISP